MFAHLHSYILLSVVVHVATSATTIPVSDPRLQFTGRYVVQDKGVAFDMPGVELRFTLDATTSVPASSALALTLNSTGSSGPYEPHFFRVFVNGTQQNYFNTSTAGIIICPLLPTFSLPVGQHQVRVFKSTEAQWNARAVVPNYVVVSSLSLPPSASLASPPTRPKRRLEFFGDSITAGYCNLCQTAGAGSGVEAESFWDSWANRVCTTTESECHTAAWSGFGVIRNCCGGTTLMSDVYKRALATDATSSWDFSSWVPDGVVVGQDGSCLTDDIHRLI